MVLKKKVIVFRSNIIVCSVIRPFAFTSTAPGQNTYYIYFYGRLMSEQSAAFESSMIIILYYYNRIL